MNIDQNTRRLHLGDLNVTIFVGEPLLVGSDDFPDAGPRRRSFPFLAVWPERAMWGQAQIPTAGGPLALSPADDRPMWLDEQELAEIFGDCADDLREGLRAACDAVVRP